MQFIFHHLLLLVNFLFNLDKEKGPILFLNYIVLHCLASHIMQRNVKNLTNIVLTGIITCDSIFFAHRLT